MIEKISQALRSIFAVSTFAIVVSPTSVYTQSSPSRAPVPGAPISVTAFVNVNVVPMDTDRVLTDQTVLVKGGRITALGPSTTITVPVNARRIDGRGKYLIPGLGDCHAHIGAMPFGRTPEIPGDSVAERRLFLWLASGVTTIRNMDYIDKSEGWLISGRTTLQFRARADSGTLWSPRIYTAGQWAPQQYISAMWPRKAGRPQPRLDSVAIYVAAYKAAGYDILKVHDESPVILDAVLAAARSVNIPVVGHVPMGDSTNLTRTLAGGIQTIEHMTGYPSALAIKSRDDTIAYRTTVIPKVVPMTVRSGVWNCATLQGGGGAGSAGPGLIRALQDSGARLLLGSDSPLGRSIHDDLETFVNHGLTPYEALATGTRNFATYLNAIEESGTISVGKRADLVLLNGNPLEAIRNTRYPAGVMIGGRWLSRETIDKRVAFIQANGGSGAIWKMETPPGEDSAIRSPVPGASKEVIAFVNVNVVPMDTERVLLDQTVLVENGWITYLGPANQILIPSQARRIDGRNKYLMPGLADMHFHLHVEGGKGDSIKAQRRLFLILSSGVTTVRNIDPEVSFNATTGLRHRKFILDLKSRAAAGTLFSPQIYTSSYVGYADSTMPGSVDDKVAAYKKAGFDFVKTQADAYAYDKPGPGRAKVESLFVATRRFGIPLVGHVPATNGWFLQNPTVYRSIEHFYGYSAAIWDASQIQTYIRATKQAGIWNCPTLFFSFDHDTTGPNQLENKLLTNIHTIVKGLQDVGAGLLLGTDISWDVDTKLVGTDINHADEPVQHELQALVRAGLTPYQALATGTKNVATFLGTSATTGTIAVGKRADLVLLNKNPVQNVGHTRQPAGVMIGGRWLPREELDQRLAALRTALEATKAKPYH